MKLTDHFTLEELIFSEYAQRNGIDNSPDQRVLRNLINLAKSLEDIRILVDEPVIVTSGYRCPDLNKAIGGSKTSAHMKGLAADIRCYAFGTPYDLIKAIIDSPIKFDQIILEFNSWVHFGLAEGRLRNQVLTAMHVDGKTTYYEGLRQ